MKRIILFFLLLYSSISYSQYYIDAELHFIDGTVKTGLAHINISNDKIKFKKNIDSERISYNHNNIAKLILKKDSIQKVFRYKKAKGRRAPRLLQLVVDHNKLSLYAAFTKYRPNGLISALFDTTKIDYVFYLVKNQKDEAIYVGERGLTSKKRMSKVIKKYLGDCPELVQKADKKEFKLKDIINIVEHYNSKCSLGTN
mgnify:CR=1 FL=1|tara:strand:+ start:24707 stop:25303 length:597 start_codon:yes stop_codon:yes gene_type:complete